MWSQNRLGPEPHLLPERTLHWATSSLSNLSWVLTQPATLGGALSLGGPRVKFLMSSRPLELITTDVPSSSLSMLSPGPLYLVGNLCTTELSYHTESSLIPPHALLAKFLGTERTDSICMGYSDQSLSFCPQVCDDPSKLSPSRNKRTERVCPILQVLYMTKTYCNQVALCDFEVNLFYNSSPGQPGLLHRETLKIKSCPNTYV